MDAALAQTTTVNGAASTTITVSGTAPLLARSVKFTGPDTIEGLAMPYGYDTDGETFTPATDFCFDWFGKSGRPFLFEHGLDSKLKSMVMGRQTDYDLLGEGIWAKVQLDRNARYRKAIDSLIEEGAIGFSSGAMPHLATKDRAGHITRWPWVELSGTPIPAHPGTMVHYVKSSDAIAHLEAVDVAIPDPLKAALSALDEWAESRDGLPDGLSYADEGDRLLVAAKAFIDRSVDLVSLRGMKAGRVLSAANRTRLSELRTRIAESHSQAEAVMADLDELLTSTNPEQTDAAKAALWAAVLAVEVARARALGVPLQGVPG